MKLRISKSSYGLYKTDNYGSHCQCISIGNLFLYYSYDTIIAFSLGYFAKTIACENVWSRTTGKHLNWISPDKSKRLKREVFQEELEKALNNFKWQTILN